MSAVRSCRVCGCTDEYACTNVGNGPCAWVDGDLCSSCEDDVAPTMFQVLDQVGRERMAQNSKWGQQDHPDGTGTAWDLLEGKVGRAKLEADLARGNCDRAFSGGTDMFAHILAEEFWEAIAEDDPQRLRAELIQVAAVAVAWAEAIDRRLNPTPLPQRLTADRALIVTCPRCRQWEGTLATFHQHNVACRVQSRSAHHV